MAVNLVGDLLLLVFFLQKLPGQRHFQVLKPLKSAPAAEPGHRGITGLAGFCQLSHRHTGGRCLMLYQKIRNLLFCLKKTVVGRTNYGGCVSCFTHSIHFQFHVNLFPGHTITHFHKKENLPRFTQCVNRNRFS